LSSFLTTLFVTVVHVQKLGAKAPLLQTQSSIEKLLLYAGFSLLSSVPPVVEVGLAADWIGVTPASIGSTQGALLQPITVSLADVCSIFWV
jgi:hypothetical protein